APPGSGFARTHAHRPRPAQKTGTEDRHRRPAQTTEPPRKRRWARFCGKVAAKKVGSLAGKTVVLGVTGGISAFKAAELCPLLRKADAEWRVRMPRAACEFITPLTLQTLSGHPVGRELFDPTEESQIGHIQLADDADVVVIAPATADAIARLAAGM